MRVVAESLGTAMVSDHRRALASYARLRGLPAAGTDGTAVRLQLPDGEMAVAFDHSGRISNLSGQAGRA
ncbi:MAG: hypothetical protein ACRD2C_27925 [Acidimicrobiales bacterium]